MRKFESILATIFGLGLLTILVFWILQAAKIEAGSIIDWMIGFATTSWLLTVTVIPWDVHFEAKTVLNDAELSRRKDIKFNETDITYVQKVARNALMVAITLHVLSAVGLYCLAYFKISVVGYYGSAASLLLTFLRPSMRLYQYLSERLRTIRFETKYPRDDVYELGEKLKIMEESVRGIWLLLNNDDNSWKSRLDEASGRNGRDIKALQKSIQDLHEKISEGNELILKETQKAVAQVNQEGKFVDRFVENLVEIVRFIKRA